ncbi:hypothetical protein [Nitrosomonas sp. sh817]|jgi:hypothetical protein|uniref:hypothetical protein n=1 Tax=unclassified Nitrosomonas TaxID=2609265 RepID=UPI0027DC1275|nr:hypothetical protein [Nitrosomonas sp. sh817]WMJ07476.1 hypothetical protein RBH92_08480 [Nitrosomonas sp. sh817]
MNENNASSDLDDSEILEKFRNLLNKYQHHGKLISASEFSHSITAPSSDNRPDADKSSEIPLLTDVVILHPTVIHPQPARLTPIRQILDSALAECLIDMNATDRKALASALEIRLARLLK